MHSKNETDNQRENFGDESFRTPYESNGLNFQYKKLRRAIRPSANALDYSSLLDSVPTIGKFTHFFFHILTLNASSLFSRK